MVTPLLCELYPLYTVQSHGVPNHIRLFLQAQPISASASVSGSGTTHHVVGTILAGMTYETRPDGPPENDADTVPGSKDLIVLVPGHDLERVGEVCRSIEPPCKQVGLSGKRLPGFEGRELRRCGEWVDEVVARLIEEGVLRPGGLCKGTRDEKRRGRGGAADEEGEQRKAGDEGKGEGTL